MPYDLAPGKWDMSGSNHLFVSETRLMSPGQVPTTYPFLHTQPLEIHERKDYSLA